MTNLEDVRTSSKARRAVRPSRSIRRLWLRIGAVLAVVTAQVAIVGSPAQAATWLDWNQTSGTLVIRSAPGLANNITLYQVGTRLIITDTSDPAFDLRSPCVVGSGGASCPVAGLNRVVIETGDGNDTITKTANIASVLRGGDGDDTINAGPNPGTNILEGGNGNDRLAGGPHKDALVGGPGNDVMSGGEGHDNVSYYYETAPGTVLVQLDGLANDGPPSETDNVLLDIEELWGSPGVDVLVGSERNETLYGYASNDTLVGGGGDDRLVGGPGDDQHYGGPGKDTIIAVDNRAYDFVNGGPDVDTCQADAGDAVSLCER